jgi:oligopeptide transport system permease protein
MELEVDDKVLKEPNQREPSNEYGQPVKGVSLSVDAWRRLKKNRMAMAGLFVVIIYVLVCLLAPILPIHDYTKIISDHQHLPPSFTKTSGELWLEKTEKYALALAQKEGRDRLNEEELAELEEIKGRIATETMEVRGKTVKVHERRYLLGTDYHGRDMLARIIYGGQMSIAVGFVGTVTSVLIGIVIGSISGYVGGKVDYILMRIVDVMYGLPYMLLVIIFMAMAGSSEVRVRIFILFLSLSLIAWLTVARVVRGQILSLKNSEFVEAARSIGASPARIIFRHLLPNTVGIIIVFSTLRIPHFIMMEAFLSFLGLGISAPYASWGSLVGDAVEGMAHYPWRLFFPALAMTLFLFSMNFLGDGLRDAFDPQSKNRL